MATNSTTAPITPESVRTPPPRQSYEVASADLQVDPSVTLGVGAKTGVRFAGQKAGIEVIATIPFSTLSDITNGRPFSLGLKAKIEVEAGPVLVVGELAGAANFRNAQSLPDLEGRGGIGIGLKGKYGSGAEIDKTIGGVGRQQTVGGLVGASFVADSSGVRGVPGFDGEYTKANEQISLLPGLSDAIGVQGKIKASATGSPLLAVAGGLGGSSYPGNEVTLTGAGKAYLNIDPVTVQVEAPNGMKLTLRNDSENGLWTLRQPDGTVIGQLDLPQLAENLKQGTQRMFEQVLSNVPQLRPVAEAIGIGSPQVSANQQVAPGSGTLATPTNLADFVKQGWVGNEQTGKQLIYGTDMRTGNVLVKNDGGETLGTYAPGTTKRQIADTMGNPNSVLYMRGSDLPRRVSTLEPIEQGRSGNFAFAAAPETVQIVSVSGRALQISMDGNTLVAKNADTELMRFREGTTIAQAKELLESPVSPLKGQGALLSDARGQIPVQALERSVEQPRIGFS
jgi:hypothetical protein